MPVVFDDTHVHTKYFCLCIWYRTAVTYSQVTKGCVGLKKHSRTGPAAAPAVRVYEVQRLLCRYRG